MTNTLTPSMLDADAADRIMSFHAEEGELYEQAIALGFESVESMREYEQWLEKHGSREYRDWLACQKQTG